MNKNNSFKCCICGKDVTGEFSNNPWPIKEEGECCEQCNYNIVLPKRIEDVIGNVRK